jgi:hypothetical protein
MKIVGYHASLNDAGQCIIADSDGDVSNSPPYTEFLMRDKGECIKVFYHLNMAVACLCRAFDFGESQCRKLYEGRIYCEGWTFKQRSGKFFSMRWGNSRIFTNFSDMSQYEDWRLSPNPTTKDLIQKAKDAKSVGEEVYAALVGLGLHPKSLVSPVNAFAKEVLSAMDLPIYDDIPEDVSEMAYRCCRGGWTEAFQKGNFKETWDFDLRSAYPSYMAKIVDVREGYWKESKDFLPDALYGYCKGKLSTSAKFHPLLFNPNDEDTYPDLFTRAEANRDRNQVVYTPTGTFTTVRHKSEINFIKKYGLGSFEHEIGRYFYPKKIRHPFKDIIESLHARKEASQGRTREVLKRVAQGIYGIQLLVRDTKNRDDDPLGDYFNAVHAAEIENPTRLEVARFVLDNSLIDHVLHIATDGVLSSMPAPYTDGPIIGSWKLSSHGPAAVISSGIAAIKGKEGTGEFHLDYDWLMEQIKQNPEASEYSLQKWSPISLGVAFNKSLNPERQQELFQKLGELEVITKSINIPYEQKRAYRERPKTGREFLERHYTSSPKDISQVAGIKG